MGEEQQWMGEGVVDALVRLGRQIWTEGHETLYLEPLQNAMNVRFNNQFPIRTSGDCADTVNRILESLTDVGMSDWFTIQTALDVWNFLYIFAQRNVSWQTVMLNSLAAISPTSLPPVLIVATGGGIDEQAPSDVDLSTLGLQGVGQYSLQGQIIYNGRHYYAQYRHHGTGQWIHVDDERIARIITPNRGQDRVVYVIYERRQV